MTKESEAPPVDNRETSCSFDRSDKIDKLAKALAQAQGAMGHAHKSGKNPHFKSSYADLADCLDAVREPFTSNGLAISQLPGYDDARITLTTILTHDSGQYIAGTAAMSPMKPGPHDYGSCLTYLRRYSLAAITGLAQADDDGNKGQGKDPGKAKMDIGSAKTALESAAREGTASLKKAWEGLGNDVRHIIGNNETAYWDGLKSLAADVDASKEA